MITVTTRRWYAGATGITGTLREWRKIAGGAMTTAIIAAAGISAKRANAVAGSWRDRDDHRGREAGVTNIITSAKPPALNNKSMTSSRIGPAIFLSL